MPGGVGRAAVDPSGPRSGGCVGPEDPPLLSAGAPTQPGGSSCMHTPRGHARRTPDRCDERGRGNVMRVNEDDAAVALCTGLYPRPEITPSEFEEFIADQLLGSAASEVSDLVVTLHEKVTGTDGTYDFDATVRYQFAGMSFLVVVEAKLHKNPIKRELVQVLHQKMQSVGAHKGIMVSASPYQTGAVAFAKAHGIAIVTVAEGRFVFETRHASPEDSGFPALVAHYYGAGEAWLLSPDDDEYPCDVAKFLLGVPGRLTLSADVDVRSPH